MFQCFLESWLYLFSIPLSFLAHSSGNNLLLPSLLPISLLIYFSVSLVLSHYQLLSPSFPPVSYLRPPSFPFCCCFTAFPAYFFFLIVYSFSLLCLNCFITSLQSLDLTTLLSSISPLHYILQSFFNSSSIHHLHIYHF